MDIYVHNNTVWDETNDGIIRLNLLFFKLEWETRNE